jgi:hypothetical protein
VTHLQWKILKEEEKKKEEEEGGGDDCDVSITQSLRTYHVGCLIY